MTSEISLDIKGHTPSEESAKSDQEEMPWINVKKALSKSNVLPKKQSEKLEGTANLEGADPELCIIYFQHGLNFRGLKNRLKSADSSWIDTFLEKDGLNAIFSALTALGKRGTSSMLDAIEQLHCVAAVKEVMNRRAGLEFVCEGSGRSFIYTLVLGKSRSRGTCARQLLI